MPDCGHKRIRCLNHYDTFRKYLCEDCGGIFICECERALALAFLPHQVDSGTEYGTRRRYRVTGFAPRICARCRGEREEPHPRAAIYGQKGKVERFYWREIFKTYCEYVRDWLKEDAHEIADILDFEQRFSGKGRELRGKARRFWIKQHHKNPKYDVKERTEAEFLAEVAVPVRKVEAEYVQIEKADQKVGKWLNKDGWPARAEGIAKEWYESQDYTVLDCERKFISVWIATFLGDTIQDPSDPRVRVGYRASTKGWTPQNRNTPLIAILLPEDFGSKEYCLRRQDPLDGALNRMGSATNLIELFDTLLDSTETLRDYLWVNDDDAIARARLALSVLPKDRIVAAVEWAIQDFWRRQPGWPDLFVFKEGDFLFSEVKSPYDKLSQAQMNWFRWAIEEANIPCEICRVRKRGI